MCGVRAANPGEGVWTPGTPGLGVPLLPSEGYGLQMMTAHSPAPARLLRRSRRFSVLRRFASCWVPERARKPVPRAFAGSVHGRVAATEVAGVAAEVETGVAAGAAATAATAAVAGEEGAAVAGEARRRSAATCR